MHQQCITCLYYCHIHNRRPQAFATFFQMRPTIKKLIASALILLVFDLCLAILLFEMDNSTYMNLDGTEVQPHSSELIRTVFVGQLISFPLISLLIGLLVALFVDRDRPYSKRIVKGFLVTLTAVYGLFAVMGLIKVVTFL